MNTVMIVILTMILQLTFAQDENAGSQSLNPGTDLFSGPVPLWQPKGEGYAFLNGESLVIRTREDTIILKGAQNKFEWSHDGHSVIYTTKDSTGNLKIFRYFLDNGKSELISLESNWSDFYPSISADDSVISYYSAKDEFFRIYYVKKDVTRKIIANDQFEQHLHPKWSPKGNHLLYYKHSNHSIPDVTLEVVDFVTKKVMVSIDGNKFDFYDWSPDGEEILAREHNTSGNDPNYYNGKLVRINLISNEKTTLTKHFKDLFTAEWSKVSNRIVFNANQNIYSIDSDGKNLRKIFSGGSFPNVDTEGKKIIFVRNKTGSAICEIDLGGKNLKVLEQKTF